MCQKMKNPPIVMPGGCGRSGCLSLRPVEVGSGLRLFGLTLQIHVQTFGNYVAVWLVGEDDRFNFPVVCYRAVYLHIQIRRYLGAT